MEVKAIRQFLSESEIRSSVLNRKAVDIVTENAVPAEAGGETSEDPAE